MHYKITKNDLLDLLRLLLKKKIVSQVLSGEAKRNRYAITPKVIKNESELTDYPVSQLMVYNYNLTDSAANYIRIHGLSNNDTVAFIGHACDVRALIELDKRKQVNFDNLFIISFEDSGYIGGKEKRMFFKKEKIDDSKIVYERLTPTDLILKFDDGSIKKYKLGDKIDINKNCKCCPDKKHALADFLLSTYALPEDSEEFIITPQSPRANSLVKELNWESKATDEAFDNQYNNVANTLVSSCQANKEQDLIDWKNKPALEKVRIYDTCTTCGMCVRSCPVCYCPVCSIHELAKKKDILPRTFVITRFTHVGDICIACGKCEVNCPVGIPLTSVFRAIRENLYRRRNYMTGVDRTSKTFRADY